MNLGKQLPIRNGNTQGLIFIEKFMSVYGRHKIGYKWMGSDPKHFRLISAHATASRGCLSKACARVLEQTPGIPYGEFTDG